MGNGQTPPGIDLGSRGAIDDGTLARAESPTPGPIGLDAKGGTAKGSGASIADQIVHPTRNHESPGAYPGTSIATQAFCTALLPRPSTVVTFFPTTSIAKTLHPYTGLPLISTVHAPQVASSMPKLDPAMIAAQSRLRAFTRLKRITPPRLKSSSAG